GGAWRTAGSGQRAMGSGGRMRWAGGRDGGGDGARRWTTSRRRARLREVEWTQRRAADAAHPGDLRRIRAPSTAASPADSPTRTAAPPHRRTAAPPHRRTAAPAAPGAPVSDA
ncbi:hypothetical protein ABZU92_13585, partial [Micromonospora arida]